MRSLTGNALFSTVACLLLALNAQLAAGASSAPSSWELSVETPEEGENPEVQGGPSAGIANEDHGAELVLTGCTIVGDRLEMNFWVMPSDLEANNQYTQALSRGKDAIEITVSFYGSINRTKADHSDYFGGYAFSTVAPIVNVEKIERIIVSMVAPKLRLIFNFNNFLEITTAMCKRDTEIEGK